MQYSKNTSFPKAFAAVIKRFFRARNVIIISEHKVGHVPLSGTMQVLLLVGILGLFSGVSYITGSYMTARTALREKDKKITVTTLEKTRIGEEMDILKRDLTKLNQNGKELSAYSQFIIDQYVSDPLKDSVLGSAQMNVDSLFGQDNDKLLERIAYLQTRIDDIRNENDHLIIAIRERTDKKIDYFEDLIAMTGMDSEQLEHMAASVPVKPGNLSQAAPAGPIGAEDDSGRKNAPAPYHSESQGGPFIPYDTNNALTDSDHELLANVDRLVLLHDIVEQLPLSQPLTESQVTGPFGKRIDPLNGHWAIHPGIDLAGPIGSQIKCTSAGKVVSAERRAAYGNMVDINHGFGIVTRYAHMSKILVHEGDSVRRGQVIGVQGSTGRSTGPHLHYEVRINDHPVNPAKFLHAGEYVSEN